MYSVSGDFMQSVIAPSRSPKVKVVFNGNLTLYGDSLDGSIETLTHIENMDTSTGMSLGNADMASVTLDFRMPTQMIPLTNGTIEPSVGLELEDGETEYVPLGMFYIADISTDNNYKTVSVKAYDGMMRTEKPYTPNIEFPNTVNNILADISVQTGVVVDVDIDYGNRVIEEYVEGTCREWIGWLAGIGGLNARMNRENKLEFIHYTSSVVEIGRDIQYLEGLRATLENPFTVHSITSGTEENPIAFGDGVGISFTNPFITRDEVEIIYNRLNGFSFAPCNVKWRGNPALEVGDIVSVETVSGEWVSVPVMSHTLTVDGGFADTFVCYGQTEESYALDKSPTHKLIQKAYDDLTTAILNATALLGGAKGGIFRITDNDNDGTNDGWIIADSPNIAQSRKFIRANYQGIGLSTDGGVTYTQAITHEGINASAVTTGKMSAQRISVNGNTLADFFDISIDTDGHPVVRIGSSANAVMLKQMNDRIGFYDTSNNLLAYFSNNAFEIIDLARFRIGTLAIIVQENGSVSFTAAE